MKTQIIFRGFEGFDHLKKYIIDSFESSVGKLDLSQVDDLKVIVGTTHARRLGHPPSFSCEAIMKSKRHTFFAKKTDAEMQNSVKKCMKAIARKFIHTSRALRDKRRNINRHEQIFQLNQAYLQDSSEDSFSAA